MQGEPSPRPGSPHSHPAGVARCVAEDPRPPKRGPRAIRAYPDTRNQRKCTEVKIQRPWVRAPEPAGTGERERPGTGGAEGAREPEAGGKRAPERGERPPGPGPAPKEAPSLTARRKRDKREQSISARPPEAEQGGRKAHEGPGAQSGRDRAGISNEARKAGRRQRRGHWQGRQRQAKGEGGGSETQDGGHPTLSQNGDR